MTAGAGIAHSEYNASKTAPVHLMQVWVTPAEKKLAPSYEQLSFTKKERTGALLPIASGQDKPNAVKVHQDVTFYVSHIRSKDKLKHELGKTRRAFLYVIDGELSVNNQQLKKGDQARITSEESLNFAAMQESEIMLIDLA